MRLLQFSLRSLLLATVLVALGCAALLNAWPWCASLVLSATLAFLVLAILGSIYRTGSTRAFWLGMAIVGWGYLWLARRPDDSFSDPRPRFQEEGPLVTSRLLCHAYTDVLLRVRPLPPLPPELNWGVSSRGLIIMGPPGGYPGSPSAPPPGSALGGFPPGIHDYPSLSDFVTVGHSLWALLLGFLGGLVARWFYATRQTRSIP